MQVATTTGETVSSATTPDLWTDMIIAISTLVSTLGGLLAYFVTNPKIKQVGQLAKAGADKLVESKQDIATLAKVTYGMLPAESAKIVDAANVRIAALEAKVNAANEELARLQNKAPG